MVKKKPKPFDTNLTQAEFRSRVISALRQLSRWWYPQQEAIARARVERGKYKCEQCWTIWPVSLPPEKGKKRKRKNIQADHIFPVVPVNWFTSYDNWIERCFVSSEHYLAICYACHSQKTKTENIERRIIRNNKKLWTNI